MTRDDIRRIMDEVPGLNDEGVGVSNLVKPEDRKRELAKGTEALLNSTEGCDRICDWLQQIGKIKTINSGRSSYGLKHIAEKDIGYVSNGAFIAAAIYCGFSYRVYPDSINVTFGMSEKSIKDVMRRQNRAGQANWGGV